MPRHAGDDKRAQRCEHRETRRQHQRLRRDRLIVEQLSNEYQQHDRHPGGRGGGPPRLPSRAGYATHHASNRTPIATARGVTTTSQCAQKLCHQLPSCRGWMSPALAYEWEKIGSSST
ncbi:hypothetical protein GCM10023170_038100 [Phytohabitans houttuyneae]